MPVTVKTFASSGEAAAALVVRPRRALSRRRHAGHARAQRGRHLDLDHRARRRSRADADRCVGRARHHRRRRHLRAAYWPSAISPSCIAPARSIGGPAVRNMGTVGGNLFAPSPYGDFTVALLALDATVSVQGGFGAREMPIEEFLQSRERQAGALVLSVSCQRPASADAFRYRKIARIKPKGGSVITLAAHLPVSSGRVARRAHRAGLDGADADPRQGRRARAGGPPARCCRDHRRRGRGAPKARRPPTTRSPAPGIAARSSAFTCGACCPVRNRIVMAKTALQFRHNGRDVAIFVDGGTNLLGRAARADRRHDAEIRLRAGRLRRLQRADRRRTASLLPDAGRGRGRPLGRDAGRHQGRTRTCIRCSAPSRTISPPSAAIARRAC